MLNDLADGRLIVEAFTPICIKYKKSARYALQQLAELIDWAKEDNRFTGDNPVNLKRKPQPSKFLKRLPSMDYEVANRRPMPWQDVPAFIAQLRAQKRHVGRGLYSDNRSLDSEVIELQILTGGRPAQARLAQWDEFDLDHQTWKVPLHTTVKGRRWHRRKRSDNFTIYINRQAVALLRAIKKRQEENEGGLRKFVFSHGLAFTSGKDYKPSYWWHRKETSRFGESDFRYGGEPVTHGAVYQFFDRVMGVKNYDLHGFRGSFKQFQIAHGYNELAARRCWTTRSATLCEIHTPRGRSRTTQ